MKEKFKNTNSMSGITLIALVITIIILLILAGVTLGQLFGENGILSRTEGTVLKYEQAQVLESLRLDVYGNSMDISDSKLDELSHLQQLGKVDSSDGSVFVDKINASMGSGRGTISEGDAYYVENGYLYYVNPDKSVENIGLVYGKDEGEVASTPDMFIYEEGSDETIITGIKEEYIVESYYYGSSRIPVRDIVKNGVSVTTLIIPNKVVKLSAYAFEYCSKVRNVIIPENVTVIEEGVFYHCSGMKNINIPSKITTIETNTFYECSSLASIKIPENVISIGNYAFYNCNSLPSITIPGNVASIGNCAFSHCSGFSSLTIPTSITSIGNRAFSYCSGITTFSIPTWEITYGEYPFAGFSKMTVVTIPESWTSIPNGMFNGWTSLAKITIPSNIKTIGEDAFYYCPSLAEVNFEEGAETIGSYAFGVCSALTQIDLPLSVQTIESNAFYDWASTQKINVLGKASVNDFTSCESGCFWNATVVYENASSATE